MVKERKKNIKSFLYQPAVSLSPATWEIQLHSSPCATVISCLDSLVYILNHVEICIQKAICASYYTRNIPKMKEYKMADTRDSHLVNFCLWQYNPLKCTYQNAVPFKFIHPCGRFSK